MSGVVEGADRVRRAMQRAKVIVPIKQAEANAKSGEELARTARLLHPGDGANRAAIVSIPQGDGSCLVDFGKRAKVTEGDSGPRPHVNPAKDATAKRRGDRMKRAVKAGIKEAFSG